MNTAKNGNLAFWGCVSCLPRVEEPRASHLPPWVLLWLLLRVPAHTPPAWHRAEDAGCDFEFLCWALDGHVACSNGEIRTILKEVIVREMCLLFGRAKWCYYLWSWRSIRVEYTDPQRATCLLWRSLGITMGHCSNMFKEGGPVSLMMWTDTELTWAPGMLISGGWRRKGLSFF